MNCTVVRFSTVHFSAYGGDLCGYGGDLCEADDGNLPHGKRSSKSTDIVTAAVASAMCCRFFWEEFTGF